MATAFRRAFSSSVSTRLVHLGHVGRAAGRTSASGRTSAKMARISSALSGLAEARTKTSAMVAQPVGDGGGGVAPLRLGPRECGDPLLGQTEQLLELGPGERRPLGRALHLDEPTGTGHHHVHVRLGAGVLAVVEVEQAGAADDPDRHRGARLQ